ncbi:hypothetical protein [Peptoniphilus asaccharolyticus]|uniref:hypothetical protein n=1 Tax=Peptoniphilus asaccharolyticus TaxID=1258 RepID=UPI001F20677E|nr:hypothetical protein [Peptoniphilus asaccharolyticus]
MDYLRDKCLFDFEVDFNEFLCGFASEDETRETIRKVFEEENYLIDPHTGVAKNIVDKLGLEKTVILSTASPYKFSSTVLEALGENLSDDEFENMNILHEKLGLRFHLKLKN